MPILGGNLFSSSIAIVFVNRSSITGSNRRIHDSIKIKIKRIIMDLSLVMRIRLRSGAILYTFISYINKINVLYNNCTESKSLFISVHVN